MSHNRFLKLLLLVGVTFIGIFILSCSKESETTVQKKVGLVGGIGGGFSDAGFNQNILSGFQRAVADFNYSGKALEVTVPSDVTEHLDYFIQNNFELIVTAGYDEAEATMAAALAYPQTKFVIIDYAFSSPPANLLSEDFLVDQASFPCGFLAAWWAWHKNPNKPVVGFVGGPEIPSIKQFSTSYIKGVEYFNALYSKDVRVVGAYATSFADTIEGAHLADSLFTLDATVIFAFAGHTGNGALYETVKQGKWAIGVDVDQFYSIPSVGSVLLTSCIKMLDNMIYDALKLYNNNQFNGGTTLHGTLSNGGVGMAPFHNYEAAIPDSIKIAIQTIQQGIINGSIQTGW